jgi:hypothetical protein
VLGTALALDREDAAIHVHFDVLRIDAWNIRQDYEAFVFLADVHARHPLAGDDVGLIAFITAKKALKRLFHFFLQAVLARPWGVTGNGHARSPRVHAALLPPVSDVGISLSTFKQGDRAPQL